MRKTFEGLIRDLDRKEGTRITFDDFDAFKKLLENPLRVKGRIKMMNFQVWMYLIAIQFCDDVVPPPGKIANDCKLKIEVVKEAIEDLKYYGFLKEIKTKETI